MNYIGVYSMKMLVVCLVLLGLAGGCAIPPIYEPISIRVKTASLTIAWDPPDINLPGSPNYVSGYRIYYSDYGTSAWQELGEIPASENPYFTIEHSVVGDGLFVFAVRSLSADGDASEFHTSLDWTADPQTGWYVWWMKNE